MTDAGVVGHGGDWNASRGLEACNTDGGRLTWGRGGFVADMQRIIDPGFDAAIERHRVG